MRNWVASALCCTILLGMNVCADAAEVENSAASAVLMDAASGRVLYEKNAHEPRLIASITKLMTALVAVETTPDLSEVVTVQAEWLAGAEGSSIYLAAGDQLTLETLLYGMLLESGNDAAQVVACYCGGDLETFVGWMNDWAEQLGMTQSRFANPSGLNEEGHYSTAFDMALCAAACMENETIARIVATKSITLEGRTFTNHNKLLSLCEGCVGLKTGYTELAGRTLVSCVERDGRRLIAVTLSDRNDWEDHIALYEYGFAAYQQQELCRAEETFRTLPVTGSLVRFVAVAPAATLTYPLAEGETITTQVELPEVIEAPVDRGGIAGQLSFYLGERKIGTTYLVYQQTVSSNLFTRWPLLERILGIFGQTAQTVLGALPAP